ncbi:MAG: hypothetical protein LBD14_02960 [Puniceicoccales bacterium]|nr:hypothetical protein [Puniceicoccales bacterium]
MLEETFIISLLLRPLLLPADTPRPGELLTAIMCALHETPIDPEDTTLGAPYFTVVSHDLPVPARQTGLRVEEGVIIYSVNVTCPLVFARLPEPPPPPPPEDVPDEALRFFARSFLNGEGADTPADAAPKDETLRDFLNGFFTGEILAAEDRLPRDEAVRTWLQQFLGTPPQQQGAST